ncbi:hypothetical protein UlMin_024700 [Ulmus minor]
MKSFKEIWTRERLISLALGQFLSILVALTGFLASKLSHKKIDASTAQSFLNYVLLAIVYGSIMLYRRMKNQTQDQNICSPIFVKAYKYTSATRIMLYDAWSIPSVMILIWINFKSKDKFQKITSAVICIAGLVTVYFSAVHAGDRKGGSKPLKGAILTVVGTTLNSVSNVIEEYKVNQDGRIKCMSMLGVFGAIIGAIQYRAVFERDNLSSINWTSEATLPFIGFSVALFMFYSLVPIMLQKYGSIMLNLSLLTSSMWAVAFDRIHSKKVDWLYFLAFGSVVVGLIIYSGRNVGAHQGCQNTEGSTGHFCYTLFKEE